MQVLSESVCFLCVFGNVGWTGVQGMGGRGEGKPSPRGSRYAVSLKGSTDFDSFRYLLGPHFGGLWRSRGTILMISEAIGNSLEFH